jgi:hypothetical protein
MPTRAWAPGCRRCSFGWGATSARFGDDRAASTHTEAPRQATPMQATCRFWLGAAAENSSRFESPSTPGRAASAARRSAGRRAWRGQRDMRSGVEHVVLIVANALENALVQRGAQADRQPSVPVQEQHAALAQMLRAVYRARRRPKGCRTRHLHWMRYTRRGQAASRPPCAGAPLAGCTSICSASAEPRTAHRLRVASACQPCNLRLALA